MEGGGGGAKDQCYNETKKPSAYRVKAYRDTLNNSNLPAFLYKCDTMNLLE